MSDSAPDPIGERARALLTALVGTLRARTRETLAVAWRDPVTVLLWLIAIALVDHVVDLQLENAIHSYVNRDAGGYMPRARNITFGLVPYRDFELSYSPLALYVWATMGNERLVDPQAFRTMQAWIYFANGALLFLLLRALRAPTAHAALTAALLLLWTWTLEGWAIALEPIVNIFLLASLLAMARPVGRRRAAVAGVLFGCALMSKQYALLALPAVVVWLLAAARQRRADSPPDDGAPRWQRMHLDVLVVFFACVGVPFLVFVLLNGLPVVDTLVHLATFGGRAGSTYTPSGVDGLVTRIKRTESVRLLIVPAVVAVALLAVRRDLRALALVLGLTGTTCALLVRTYPHYAQLVMPFALLTIGSVALGSPPGVRRHGVLGALALCLLVALLPPSFRAQPGIGPQRELARAISKRVPKGARVLVCNRRLIPLYAMSDIRAPLDNYRFRLKPEPAYEDRRDDADYAVCLPKDLGRRGFKKWLRDGGMTEVNDRPLGRWRARIYHRPDAPLLDPRARRNKKR